jgi:uncharacterized protein YqfA (UPF0365 family)
MSVQWILFAEIDNAALVYVVVMATFAILFVILAVIVFAMFGPWLQAFMAGCPISATKVLGMRLRRVDARQVVRCGIMAAQAGHPIPWAKLESAYLQGVDLEKVTLAYIQAMGAKKNWTFDDLVDGARQQRLEKMLQ